MSVETIELPDLNLGEAIDYKAYRGIISELLSMGKTTGPNQSDKYVQYTVLNQQRMNRLDKTIKLQPKTIEALASIEKPQTWLILTEAWCGDAAQNIPVIQKMADVNENISVKLLWRDENPGVMDLFLTNGARSIPKLIILDEETKDILGTWGPRPSELQEIMLQEKKEPTMSKEEFSVEVQKWYNKNKGVSAQEEIASLLK